FIFGLTAQAVAATRAQGYRPREGLERNAELQAALEVISSHFDARSGLERRQSDGEPDLVVKDLSREPDNQGPRSGVLRAAAEGGRGLWGGRGGGARGGD